MNNDLVCPREIDILYRWPRGRAQRLAKRGRLPHYVLPNGEIRFKLHELLALIRPAGPLPPTTALLNDLPEGNGEGAL